MKRTENPGWVRWSWHILDGGGLPEPSENDINEDRRASRERSEVITHGWPLFEPLLRGKTRGTEVLIGRSPDPALLVMGRHACRLCHS